MSARVSYGIALLLLWPIKGRPIRGQHAASSSTTTEPLDRSIHWNHHPLLPNPSPPPPSLTVIAGGSFARPSEVLRLVSYLEGNIVRGLPGPVNRLLTLWDVEREEMTPAATPSHTLYKYIQRKVFLVNLRGDKGLCVPFGFGSVWSFDGWNGFLVVEKHVNRKSLFSVYRLPLFSKFGENFN